MAFHPTPAPTSIQVPHFVEVGAEAGSRPTPYLAEDVFADALDALVITCVDLVFLAAGRVLLGKRAVQPRQDWWVIGGRMIAGETPLQAAQRKAKQEAGLELGGDRFRFTGVYSTHFARRSRHLRCGELHSVNLTYGVALHPQEQAAIALDTTEYATWQWFEVGNLRQWLDSSDPMNRALLQVVQDAALYVAAK